MGLLDTVKAVVGGDGAGGVTIREYRCGNCDATFDSAKEPDRVECPECLSTQAELVD